MELDPLSADSRRHKYSSERPAPIELTYYRRPSDNTTTGLATTTVDIEPAIRGSVQAGRTRRVTDESSLVTHARRHSSQTTPQSLDETGGDNVSELSFTSAYSHPTGYWDTEEQDRMETTV